MLKKQVKYHYQNNLRGQSLLEIVFAFAVMSTIVIAIVGMSALSIRNNSYAKSTTLSNKYAQEAQEWIRSEKETNWNLFVNRIDTGNEKEFCLELLNWSNSNCDFIDIIYERKVVLSTTDERDIVNAKVTVEWIDAKGAHQITNSTDYSNWN